MPSEAVPAIDHEPGTSKPGQGVRRRQYVTTCTGDDRKPSIDQDYKFQSPLVDLNSLDTLITTRARVEVKEYYSYRLSAM